MPFSHIIGYKKRVTADFETIAPNVPKITFNTKSSKVPIIWSTRTPSRKFHSSHSTASHFRVTGSFETVTRTPNDAKTSNTKMSTVPNIDKRATTLQLPPPRVPIFSPFHSTASHFRVTGHLYTRTIDDPPN